MSQRRRPLEKKPLDKVKDDHPPSTDTTAVAVGKRRYLPNSPFRVSTYSLLCLLAALFSWGLYQRFWPMLYVEHTNIPVNLPKLVDSDHSQAERFWGTYRSNLYFGLKHRSAQSLSGGLMWFDYGTLQVSRDRFLRHWCDQNDRLKYGWTYHDGERFGIEKIEDRQVHLQIQWIKQVTGQHGGDWTSRIHVLPQTSSSSPISLFFYFHHDHPWIHQIRSRSKQSPDSITIRGHTKELDGFTIKINAQASSQVAIRTMTDVFQLDTIHQHILNKLTANPPQQPYILLVDQPLKSAEHNTLFVQITLQQPSLDQPFFFDVIYQSDSSTEERQQDLTGSYFAEELIRLQQEYDQRFEQIFQLKAKQKMDEKSIQFARSTLSHLVGGISYFTGQSLVAKANQPTPDQYWPTSLYTAVPSRSFFPRGFLWDEGFHNLLIARWNRNITRDILSHWFDMLNDNGWIPREIILGDEARARVPSEFIVQYTSNANPPTFFLTIDYLLKTDEHDPLFTLPFIERLEKWYQWYNRTQSGLAPFSFRWRGRNASSIYELNPKTLTSGLDDYPRASHPTDAERHLDLRCWMALASSVLGRLYSIRRNPLADTYMQYAQLLTDNDQLDQLHWSENDGMYADYGLHTDSVKLKRVSMPRSPSSPPESSRPITHMIRQVTKQADLNLKHVRNFGYVSLFPLMTRILSPQSDKLGKIIEDLRNSTLLWTPYGLRSLAKSSPVYGVRNTEHDPLYWRGAIWINMNYMVLSALQHYAQGSGPHASKARSVYDELRANVLRNMLRVYEKTGDVWEQYDDKTGEGKGCHPFTGWSSLIVLIMSELYDE